MTSPHTLPAPRPLLRRSIAFWLLFAGSAGTLAAGIALTVPNIDTMTSTLLDNTATGVEVYSGQAWVTLGAALAGAGAIGLALTLALAAASSLIPRTDATGPAPVEDEPVAEDESPADELVVPETQDAAEVPERPVAEDDVVDPAPTTRG